MPNLRSRLGRRGVVVEGADLVTAAFLTARDQINDKLRESGRPVADAIAETQRQMVPVRSGRTRDSIVVSDTPTAGPDAAGAEALYEIGPTHFVGRFLELGTRKMGPQPFVWPSARAHEQDWIDAAIEAAGDV